MSVRRTNASKVAWTQGAPLGRNRAKDPCGVVAEAPRAVDKRGQAEHLVPGVA